VLQHTPCALRCHPVPPCTPSDSQAQPQHAPAAQIALLQPTDCKRAVRLPSETLAHGLVIPAAAPLPRVADLQNMFTCLIAAGPASPCICMPVTSGVTNTLGQAPYAKAQLDIYPNNPTHSTLAAYCHDTSVTSGVTNTLGQAPYAKAQLDIYPNNPTHSTLAAYCHDTQECLYQGHSGATSVMRCTECPMCHATQQEPLTSWASKAVPSFTTGPTTARCEMHKQLPFA
jgi:hypothetical protein